MAKDSTKTTSHLQHVEAGRFFVLVRVLEHWFIPIMPGSDNDQAVFTTRGEAERCVELLIGKYGEKAYRSVQILVA